MRYFVLSFRFLVLAVFVLQMPLNVFAQIEAPQLSLEDIKDGEIVDSIRNQPTFEEIEVVKDFRPEPYPLLNYKLLEYFNNRARVNSSRIEHTPYSFPVSEVSLFNWNKGAVVANGTITSNPGLMNIARGELGVNQSFGNFSFYVGGNATKYAYFNGLHTQYGVNGSLTYWINDQVSIAAIGSYYFGKTPSMPNGMPMSPAMLGYYNVSRFGGYVDYRFSDKFGVEVGAQMVEQVGDHPRCYTLEPIVTPYWSPGGRKSKVKIGLPIGQVVYHILRRAIH